MKQFLYHLIWVVSLGLFLTSCADDLTENLAVQNVSLSVQVMEELNSLDPLKSYKTSSNISPNFKLGAALKASDLAAGGNVRALAAANFDEVVDADIMQYAACVSEDGTMNFTTVSDFVETAQKAGLGVYGQSLVSHKQQQVAYLSTLIADREPSAEDLVPIEKPYELDLITNSNCEGSNENYYANDPTEGISTDLSAVADDPVQGKCMVVNSADQAVYAWDSQFFIKVDHAFKAGEKAKLTMKIKADVAQSADGCQAHGDAPGAYKHWAFFANPDFTTEWVDYVSEITVDANQDGAQVIAFNLCKGAPNPGENDPKDPGPVTKNRYYFDDIQINVSGVDVQVIEAQKIPLTAEEKRDTLTWAMNRWIDGLMSATGGYIQAWNVISDAIANEGDDGNGNYPLLHADSPNNDAANAFYWQDNMGDLEYVRTAVEAARKAYKGNASDLKLFVNDYNLNNDADDNKKCKSLIAWVEKWEADGKTKIDGIGTELHLSCYDDAATNTKKKEAVAKMFELLAASKKLVRVSALDIDFKDKSGKSLQVHELTDAQQQQMADLYKFVVKTYLEKVPTAQQYGICQWTLIDSNNLPKGLWTDQFRRKLTFKGFAEGLSGK